MEKIDSFRLCFLYFHTRGSIFGLIIAAFGYGKFNAKLHAFDCCSNGNIFLKGKSVVHSMDWFCLVYWRNYYIFLSNFINWQSGYWFGNNVRWSFSKCRFCNNWTGY